MKSKCVCLAMLLCLALVLGSAGFAQEEIQPLEPEWLSQMYAEGWEKAQEGVLRRDLGQGRFETFGYGAEGYQWLIERYSQQLTYFEGEYRESPTEELASLVDRLEDQINALQDEALTAPTAESFDGSQMAACTFSYDATAYAGPLTSAQGVMAEANAYFNGTCTTGQTFAYAYARAVEVSVATTQSQEDPKDGASVVSHAYASALGSTECESRAQASVQISNPSFFYATPEEINNQCPEVLDDVSITGPAQVTTDYYGSACADVTWTATTASGRTDYTFEWYIGTTLEGTGTTLTKSYCNESTTVTPRVVASDGAGWSDDATFTTAIQYSTPIVTSVSGPATTTIDSSSSSCATVTWTASATGGHPGGYTYTWYIGTDPTVQGTGSTFSKSFCNASQTVSVKAVAQDSDGHTDDATSTTNIQYVAPLAASISGPASVTTDYYGPTCVNVTWTAGATNGHPGYTYSWYLGTSTGTTVQGTGSTFTKSLCTNNQSVTVRVLDSDGHSATTTFTTNVQRRPAIVAQITGPATVSTNSTTPCASVTWTASASSGSGHSGYTYKWYLGTGTTVQGTGSAFTKQYCSTTTTVTVKLIATASDGHADDVTFNTSVTHTSTPPLAASINGPYEAYLRSCQSITWTSSVSGGTPAYTYSWTMGTSTTVLSTTSSLTRSVCPGQTYNVKLTVRDSASQSKSATFTTDVYYPETEPCTGPGICPDMP